MTSIKPGFACFVLTVGGCVGAFGAQTGRADESARFRELLKEKSTALVTIKFILKVRMGGMMGDGEEETESEIAGVLIDEKGLVLCGNGQLGGFIGMMSRFMGPMGEGISLTPVDLKVLIGNDAEGREAELIARDTELDLAWVRLKKPSDQPLHHVDFSQSVDPMIGDAFVAIRRMDKYFARADVVSEGRIGGITKSPRKLYVPTGMITSALGLPVYTKKGEVIGFAVQQMPDAEAVESNPMAMFGQMSGMQDMMIGFILPAADVVRATKRAMESTKSE